MKINRQFCGGQRSDSGKFAFISGERKACLFDSENEKVIDTFSFSADAVTFDQEENYMYAMEMSGKLHVYNILEKKEVFSKQLLQKDITCESGVGVTAEKIIYFIGNDENAKHYCFQYELNCKKLKYWEIEIGSLIAGNINGKILYNYSDEEDFTYFQIISKDMTPQLWIKSSRIDECKIRNNVLFFIQFEGTDTFLIKQNDKKIVQKEKLVDELSHVFKHPVNWDTDGRYMGVVFYDENTQEDRVICYDLLKKRFLINEEMEYAKRICIMKNGILYGGMKTIFVPFEKD